VPMLLTEPQTCATQLRQQPAGKTPDDGLLFLIYPGGQSRFIVHDGTDVQCQTQAGRRRDDHLRGARGDAADSRRRARCGHPRRSDPDQACHDRGLRRSHDRLADRPDRSAAPHQVRARRRYDHNSILSSPVTSCGHCLQRRLPQLSLPSTRSRFAIGGSTPTPGIAQQSVGTRHPVSVRAHRRAVEYVGGTSRRFGHYLRGRERRIR